jgi:pimeloyl-ACP methyl ester carboxylesterase
MQVIVDGLSTNYHVSGDGHKTVLLLHGWGDSSLGLAGLQQELSKNFTVVAPDLPGFGKTDNPPSPWGLSDYANFVKAFMHKLKINEIYAIIGHSNGGAIAIRAVGKGLLGPDKLILLASSGVRSPYNGRQKGLRLLVKTGKAVTMPLPKIIKRKLRMTVYNTIGSEMLIAEDLHETFKKIVSDDVTADAGRISIPTLLIYGEEDRATSPATGRLFHEKIKNSIYEQVASAGHFVHLDQPALTNKAIGDFLHV